MNQPEVVKDLVYEEMLNHEMQKNYRKYLQETEDLKKANSKTEQAEINEAIAKAREDEANVREKEALAIAKQLANQLKTAITNFQSKGMSIAEIASICNVSEEEIKKILTEA